MLSSDIEEWAVSIVGSDYVLQVGQWVETTNDAQKYYLVVRGAAGANPVADTRKKNYELILVGRRGTQSDAEKLELACDDIMQAIMGGVMPCGAANIVATSEPLGPGFTTENRAWYQLNVQVTF